MKLAVLLLGVVVATSAKPAAPNVDKRFITDTFEAIGHWFTTTWNNAKNEFIHLTSGLNINFDQVVNALIPFIDSGMTESACSAACVGVAATVLGPAAPLAQTVCGPVCSAALAKLEEIAG